MSVKERHIIRIDSDDDLAVTRALGTHVEWDIHFLTLLQVCHPGDPS